MHKLTAEKLADKSSKVAFIGFDGSFWRSPGNGNPRQLVAVGNRAIEKGELWNQFDNFDDSALLVDPAAYPVSDDF